MHIKLLQLNIFKGKYLDNVIDFVKRENFDIIHLQEVTGGKKSNGGVYSYPDGMNIPNGQSNSKSIGVNLFEELKKIFEMNGELIVANQLKNDPASYEGNATLFKKHIQCIEKKVIWLKEYKEIEEDYTDWATIGRAALSLQFKYQGTKFYSINTHLAWGPNQFDKDYKLIQAEKLVNYIKTIDSPFILTGDFNVAPETKLISLFNSIGRNLITENKIQNTLNLKIHPALHNNPLGFAVDYIFVDEKVKVVDFHSVSDRDLSDHIGLVLEFEC